MRRALLLLSLGYCLQACDGGAPLDPEPEPQPEPVDPCDPAAALPDTTRTVTVDGIERNYRLHLPSGYDRSPTPLVLNFHGLGSNGLQQEFFSEMDPVSDAENFIVAYPDGVGESWNAGVCCDPASSDGVDDVAFASAIIDDVATALCLDPKQVFAAGMSNGGFMSHRLGCELADRIAAIGPVAGGVVLPVCEPSRPMPVIHFHGTADDTVPFNGLPAFGLPAVPDMIADWADRNGCVGAPVETFLNGDSRCETFQDCAEGAEVTLCVVDGGGHTWPGGLPIPQLGFTTQDLDASQAMWDFFEQHPLP